MRGDWYSKFPLAFIDVLITMMAGTSAIALVCLALLNPKSARPIDENVPPHAEFILTIEWPASQNVDVDSWLMDPYGNVVSYITKSSGLMFLDLDDLGNLTDTIRLPDGSKKVIGINRETMTIRGIVPGEYVLNVHWYSTSELYDKTVEVNAVGTKLRPFAQFAQNRVVLDRVGQEMTAFRFTVSGDGSVLATSTEQFPFVLLKKQLTK